MVQRRVLTFIVITFALVAGLSAASAGAQNEFAFTRAQHLRRGINLSMWYAQAPGHYTPERLATFTTPADFQLIHDLGFDHVRLSIDPEPLIARDASESPAQSAIILNGETMARLCTTVQQITATGLVVILDIHPESAWKKAATTTAKGSATLLSFWGSFARSFARSDPAQVYFEVLNEPEAINADGWAKEQARAVAVIRSQAPHHTIIVTAAEWGGIGTLVQLKPLPDNNIIYSFHDYAPMDFTHQGATWAGEVLKPLRGVPYPSTPANVEPLLKTLTDGAARKSLAEYGEQHWSIARMAQQIGVAKAWGKQHHVPLWCGEFGVYRGFAPPADRARWITDMRTTLEADGIGWNMWDYQSAFGLVTKKDGITTVDPAIAEALGIKTPTPSPSHL